MSIRKNFNGNWVFFDGEIKQEMPSYKGPAYIQAKTERYRIGPASIFYKDVPDDYGMRKQTYQTKELTSERWEHVTLPHDYIIRQEPKETNNNALGFFEYHPAWYRKHFSLEIFKYVTTCLLVWAFKNTLYSTFYYPKSSISELNLSLCS